MTPAMDLIEFRGRVLAALIQIHELCDADLSVRQQVLPQDVPALLAIVRTAAEELIFCSSVDEAINRLTRNRLVLGAVEYVSSEGRSDAEIESVIRLAHAKHIQDAVDLPYFAFASYLIELCDGLKPGQQPLEPQS